MSENMLSEALQQVSGPLKDLLEKLGGRDGRSWLSAFKRFLRKQNPWPNWRAWRTMGETKLVWVTLKDLGLQDGDWLSRAISEAISMGLRPCPRNVSGMVPTEVDGHPTYVVLEAENGVGYAFTEQVLSDRIAFVFCLP